MGRNGEKKPAKGDPPVDFQGSNQTVSFKVKH
jgi:hypothetical protein